MRALLLVLLAAAGRAAAAEAPRRIAAPEFSAVAPAGWTVEPSTGGSTFARSPEKGKPGALILLVHRRPVAGEPADAEAYAKRRLAPDELFGVESDYKREKDARVAGRACPVLTRTVDYLDRHAKDRPLMAETLVVVPAATGYYLLTLHGPAARRDTDRKAFQRVLDGFKPAL